MGLADLNKYLNNPAAAATNENVVLEELVTKLTTITTINAEISATTKKITEGNRQLQKQLEILKNIPQEERGTGQIQPAVKRKPVTCPNCKQEVWQKLDECFYLKKSARRPEGWTTRLWRCGFANSVVKNNLKSKFSANKHVVLTPPVANNPQPTQPNHQDTGVVDSGANNIYFAKEALIQNFNDAAPKVHMGTATS